MVQRDHKLKQGRRVGNSKLISSRFKKDDIFYFRCQCICGILRDVREWHLKHNKTLSCGCNNTVGRFKYHGCGDLSKSYYNSFKRGRKNKNFQFDEEITIEYLWNLFIKQNKKCALSGIELFMDSHWSGKRGGSYTQTASIDRIDNLKGYVKGNIQWVHKKINLMKGTMNEIDFKKFCTLVAKKNGSTGK